MALRRHHVKGAPRDQVARFWFFVDKNGPTIRPELGQCWTWTGTFSRGGAQGRQGDRPPKDRYGAHTLNGKRTSAHRHAWELANGPIGDAKMFVRHKCDNPTCVNPAHLELGTPLDNVLDMIQRGRAVRSCGSAKITADTVRDVRRLAAEGARARALAERFSMTIGNVYAVIRRQTWKHVA